MRHLATFYATNLITPFGVQCSCGVGGSFASQEAARDWMQYKHFAKLSGIAYGEFSAAPIPSEPTPAPESASEGLKKKQTETPVPNAPVKGVA